MSVLPIGREVLHRGDELPPLIVNRKRTTFIIDYALPEVRAWIHAKKGPEEGAVRETQPQRSLEAGVEGSEGADNEDRGNKEIRGPE